MMTSCWVHRCASPVSIKEGFAAGDGDVAGQHLEGGGFTGPVDSQQPETLSGHNGRRQLDSEQHGRASCCTSTRLSDVCRLFEHSYATLHTAALVFSRRKT